LLGCKANDITLTELAKKLGITQPTLSNRLKTGKFTQDELANMAKLLNCEYQPLWILPDGTKLL
jgi:transcriptional regulator with XRE-family HTH domain